MRITPVKITFLIGDLTGSETRTWQDGADVVLNLTAGATTSTPIRTRALSPQNINSNASGYNKYVGLLTYDYPVVVTILVVNSGAAGSVAFTATDQWDCQSKTRSETAFMVAAEEREFVFEFQQVTSTDKWTWDADVTAITILSFAPYRPINGRLWSWPTQVNR